MKCHRRECGRMVPRGRRKYCSDDCRLKATAARRASFRRKQSERLGSGRRATIRHRACLRCGRQFLSQGPWNRFCENCAQRNARIRCIRHQVPGEWPQSSRLDLERN